MVTSLNNAEIKGLTWKYVNLTNNAVFASNGTAIPPNALGVFENVYTGKRGSVKSRARARVQPIPAPLIDSLRTIKNSSKFSGPDDPVFVGRTGRPVDMGGKSAISKRLKKIGAAIGVPGLSWQSLRRTAATLSGQTGMAKADRIAIMGHADGAMTDYYSDSDIERRRVFINEMAGRLAPGDDEVAELTRIWEKE